MFDKNVCPECSGSMEQGFLVDRTSYSSMNPGDWIEGEPEESFWTGTKTRGRARYRITSLRCTTCGYLKFYANEKSEE
jgi:hypothetical protein